MFRMTDIFNVLARISLRQFIIISSSSSISIIIFIIVIMMIIIIILVLCPSLFEFLNIFRQFHFDSLIFSLLNFNRCANGKVFEK